MKGEGSPYSSFPTAGQGFDSVQVLLAKNNLLSIVIAFYVPYRWNAGRYPTNASN